MDGRRPPRRVDDEEEEEVEDGEVNGAPVVISSVR